jgi:hypothetical protein
MAGKLRAPRECAAELGEAQCLLLETLVDPPADPWYEQAMGHARRTIIAVVGFTVLIIGIVMVIAPGPAFLVIPFGLLILGTEFVWARRLLKRIKAAALARRGTAPGVSAVPGTTRNAPRVRNTPYRPKRR